ncbi:NAD(P)/FAD-dependent oxidoreductase [Hydrogenophaga sp.]|uniref:NAD(P)/FAD-dependent oxidoreductase n=1 Tax=Hydrogenophaga sp. TaxID=1904254 RepID=UPI00272F1826|nr:FAD-dependent oxidoreductase [Hydrogenophaga sp.]MDP2073831.1 FAD-dependent oxidoreductase [Hydrogenophaga sp.]MDP3108995.1 FAD-dependent oxidoreductase [Hydrogenophaga sp.]MDP3349023.1 FAD-dependent oxidoreductase [Hydrogenophaga sp.]
MYTDLISTPSRPVRGDARPPRVAIVGSGISGLAAAHTLQGLADITLFEAGDYFGGHTHTVDMTLPNAQGVATTFGVDTGFLVLNERTYPNLLALFAQLGVPIAKSDMSFSVQAPGAAPGGGPLEWSGCNLSTVFAQRRNLFNPRFLRMLADIVRFNRITTRLAEQGEDLRDNSPLLQPLGEFLKAQGFSDEFRDWYFLPMMGCIWSCPTDQMLAFPVATMVRFCHNHGLIQVTNRPQWYTVDGGARQYVQKITDNIADKRLNTPVQQVLRDSQGVRVVTEGHVERFDAIVLACHSDQALRLLGGEASADEREVLGAIRYQPNRAVLHTDASVLPRSELAWAAWNYERAPSKGVESAQVCLHYLLNRLQPLPVAQPVVVSLNPQREIAAKHVVGEYEYDHPVFDLAAIRAQARVPAMQGQLNTYFAGAWTGYGFHEDGLKSGLHAARALIDAHQLVPMTQRVDAQRAALPGVFA